jgi:TRAP-type mannitol/chloroaromatic compound transport system substrate-binding protein
MRGPLAAGFGALLVAMMTTGAPAMAAAAELPMVKLDVASTFPSTLRRIGGGALRPIETIERASDGRGEAAIFRSNAET